MKTRFISKPVNRRKFVQGLVSATGAILAGSSVGNVVYSQGKSDAASFANYELMKQVMKYRKIDAYAIAYADSAVTRAQIEFADRLGIEKLVIAVAVAQNMHKTPEEVRSYNNLVYKAVKKYPDRFVGQFTLNPEYTKESLDEIERCIDLGMVGMKLYNHVKINNPLCYPVIERFIKYKMVIHVHGESQLGVGGYRMKYDVKNNPNISIPEDFVEVAKRYPEAMFQYAHIGGGSDWEYACKTFTHYPNIYVDTGGSNNQENMIDFAVETLGEDRVFFGSDGSYYQGVGKILSSGLNEKQKRKIFFENYNNLLKRSGKEFS